MHRSPGDSPEATAAAEKAASAEASANADSSNAAAYARDALLAVATEADDVIGTVTVASAATIPQVVVIPIDVVLPLSNSFSCIGNVVKTAFAALPALAPIASAHRQLQ